MEKKRVSVWLGATCVLHTGHLEFSLKKVLLQIFLKIEKVLLSSILPHYVIKMSENVKSSKCGQQ